MDERVSIVEEVLAKPHLITDKSSHAQKVESAKVYLRLREALKGLAEDNHPAAEPLVLRLAESDIDSLRGIAIGAMGEMREPSDTIITTLEKMMVSDQRMGMRASAAAALLQLRHGDDLDPVIEAIRDQQFLAKFPAHRLSSQLFELSKKEPPAFEPLKEVLETGGEASLRVLSAFWNAGEQHRAFPFIPGFRELPPKEAARILRIEWYLYILPAPGIRLEYRNTRDLCDYFADYYLLLVGWEGFENPLYLCAPRKHAKRELVYAKVRQALRGYVDGEWCHPDSVSEYIEVFGFSRLQPYPEGEFLFVSESLRRPPLERRTPSSTAFDKTIP
ncbi:MAG: HEAT repeat domain-containing protein [Promethearchaeota archaeon]